VARSLAGPPILGRHGASLSVRPTSLRNANGWLRRKTR
jgi:hypothetical protein